MRALVLSGGASKGAFQVGVLKNWMGDRGTEYDIISGVSVGALNAAGLAMTRKGDPVGAIKWVERFWRHSVRTDNVYKRWFPFGRLHALWRHSVYDSTPLIDLMKSSLNHNNIANNGRMIAVGSVCLETGEHRYARETDMNFIDWVIASASVPVFFPPVLIDGKLWSDGGLKNITPLGAAIELGATHVDVITCNPLVQDTWISKKRRALPDQVVRTLDLLLDRVSSNDIEMTLLKNKLSLMGNESEKSVKLRVASPDKKLVDNTLDFSRESIDRMIDVGYRCADNAVDHF